MLDPGFLFWFGVLCLTTPFIVGGSAPTDDPVVNMMLKLDPKKIHLMNGMTLSGIMFMLTAVVMRVVK